MSDILVQVEAQLIDEVSGPSTKVRAALKGVEDAAQSTGTRGATAIASIAPATDVARTGLLGITRAQKLQGLGMAQNINLASELALGFGALDPRLRSVALAAATAGNNSFQLASALGPVGVVLGTIVGIAPAVFAVFRNMGSEAEEAAADVDRLTQSFNDLVSAQTSARREQESEEELFSGEADASRIEDALSVVRQQQDEARSAEQKRVRESSSLGGTFAPLARALMSAPGFNENGVSPEAFREANERLGTNAGSFEASIIQQLEVIRARRVSSGGTAGLEQQAERLRAGLTTAQARERQEALAESAANARGDVGLADEVLERVLRDEGVSSRASSRLTSSLSGSDGSSIDLRGISSSAVRSAAQRAALARQRAAEFQRTITDRETAELDENLAGSRILDGLQDPNEIRGGGGGASSAETIMRARSASPGRIDVNLLSNGRQIGSFTATEGETSSTTVDASTLSPEGLL